MADHSKIEWTDATWNVVTGCSRVSEGCRHCYAERLAATRLAHVPAYEGLAEMTPAGPRWTGAVRFNLERLALPLRWAKPRMVFVNSQSDLFHEGLTNEQIASIFGVMAACPQHVFQILTKRADRMLDWFGWLEKAAVVAKRDLFQSDGLDWTRQHVMRAATLRTGMAFPRGRSHVGMDAPWPLPNVWLGVSAEDQATADERIPPLLECPAAVRWLSAEPLLGPIDLAQFLEVKWFSEEIAAPKGGIGYPATVPAARIWPRLDWVVVGGESGPGARPMHPDWARLLQNQCETAGVPFFFKQWGNWIQLSPSDGRATHVLALAGKCSPRLGRPITECLQGGGVFVGQLGKRDAGRLLDGRTWDEMPEVCHA